MLPLGHPASAPGQRHCRGCAWRLVTRQPVYLGGYSAGCCGWDDSPQPGTDQIIFPQVVEVLTLLESVSWVEFCRQCYLLGSACRCLESCSTASTASTTGPLWSDIADPTFGTNPAPLGEAPDRRFHMDLQPWQAAPFGICLLRISQGSNSWPSGMDWLHHQIPWDFLSWPGGRLLHRTADGFSCLCLYLRLIQPQRLTRVSRQRPRTRSPEGQGTQRPGWARARGHSHGPTSSLPRQPRTSQPAPGRSGGASRSEQRRAPDWNPLARLSTHRSGGWKKDLDFYMGAYFRLNYRQEPASKWPELKAKFFQFLIDHHSEWKSIRNNIRSGISRTWRYNSSGWLGTDWWALGPARNGSERAPITIGW